MRKFFQKEHKRYLEMVSIKREQMRVNRLYSTPYTGPMSQGPCNTVRQIVQGVSYAGGINKVVYHTMGKSYMQALKRGQFGDTLSEQIESINILYSSLKLFRG